MGGKILIAHDSLPERKIIIDVLRKAGYQVAAETTDMAHTLRRIRSLYCDLVIVDSAMDGGKGSKTAEIIHEDQLAAVILLVDNEVSYLARRFHYLIKPVNYDKLIPAVESAIMYWGRENDLRKQIKRLQEQLETRKILDKAKGLLIDSMGLNESEAHHFIQKEAMNRSLTLKQVALEIMEKLSVDKKKKS